MNPLSPDFFDVRAFHLKFQLPIDEALAPVALMSSDAYAFRKRFLWEEFEEYGAAWDRKDLVKATDALLDFVYVVFGTALFMRAGTQAFVGRTWPSFDSTTAFARSHGYLVVCPPAPDLLPMHLHAMIERRLGSELEIFDVIHTAADEAAVPMALAHLWNAAWAAYLAAALMNVPWAKCWSHVQTANLAKRRATADGSDSKRRSPWDVVKPEGWTAPDVSIALELSLAGARRPL